MNHLLYSKSCMQRRGQHVNTLRGAFNADDLPAQEAAAAPLSQHLHRNGAGIRIVSRSSAALDLSTRVFPSQTLDF